MNAPLRHRHAPGCIMAGLVLGVHLALGLALGPDGVGEQTELPPAQTLVTVQLSPTGVRGDAPAKRALLPAVPVPRRPRDAAPLPLVTINTPHYFPAIELSEYPRVIEDLTPDLQRLDLRRGPAQSAVLRLLISELGDIDAVEVLHSELDEAVMSAALATYTKLKFRPGRIGELNVKSRLEIELRLENVPPTT